MPRYSPASPIMFSYCYTYALAADPL